jgi:hypothetical protein
VLTQEEILSATPEQAKRLLAQLAGWVPLLIVQASRSNGAKEHAPDELLDADTAATRMKMHPKSLRKWPDCPFLVIRGRRKLYSSHGIDRWIAEQTR